MKINYDPQADALYIYLRKGNIDESDEVAQGVIIDYDDNGQPLGIEFLDAAKLFGGKKELHIEMALTENIKK